MFLQPGAYQLHRGNEQIMWKQQVEEHPIQGAWDVKFEGMDMNVPFSDLISWHESDDTAIRYYSGIATYTREFDPPSVEENAAVRSEEHTSELHSLMRNSYAGFCLQ